MNCSYYYPPQYKTMGGSDKSFGGVNRTVALVQAVVRQIAFLRRSLTGAAHG